MDYDKFDIAEEYVIGRAYSEQSLLERLSRFSLPQRWKDNGKILDIGCGTGRYIKALYTNFTPQLLVGIDPSRKMLTQAKSTCNEGIHFVNAKAEELPLIEGCFSLAFISMVLHHLNDLDAACENISKTLTSDGVVLVRAVTLESMPDIPYLDFFPSLEPMMADAFQSRTLILEAFANAGLHLSSHQCVRNQLAVNWSDYLHRIATRSDSFMARMPNNAFESGVHNLRCFTLTASKTQPVSNCVENFVLIKTLD